MIHSSLEEFYKSDCQRKDENKRMMPFTPAAAEREICREWGRLEGRVIFFLAKT